MKSTTSDKVIQALKRFFVTHGLPLSVKTDNGPQFVSFFEMRMRGKWRWFNFVFAIFRVYRM